MQQFVAIINKREVILMIKNRLRQAREEKGLSQTDVAQLLNISRQAYNHYETGKREPTVETISKLAEIFDVSTDYLLGKTDQKKPLVNGDEELTEYLEELKNRDELRMLFSLTKKATKADVEKAVKIIEALLKD